MKTPLIAAAMLTALSAAGLAQAQTTTTTTSDSQAAVASDMRATALIEADNDSMVVPPLNMTVGQIEDLDVYSTAGDRIGEVEDVLMTPEGQAAAVTVEVGGFLGIGDREVILPLDQLSLNGDRLVTQLSKAQIEALDAWDR